MMSSEFWEITPTQVNGSNVAKNILKWTEFVNLYATQKIEHDDDWDSLCAMLENPLERDTKSKLPLLKLQTFGELRSNRDSLRHDENIIDVYGVEGDYDSGEVSIEEAANRLKRYGFKAFLYTSPSNGLDGKGHRWRILAPLSSPITPYERLHYVEMLNGALGGILASESGTASQAFFLGKVNGVEYKTIKLDGNYLDQHDEWDAIPVKKDRKQASIDGSGSFEYTRLDIGKLTANIVNGIELHNSLRDLAAHYVSTGVKPHAAIEMLQGLLEGYTVRDQRWHDRFNQIPKLVATAAEKFPYTPIAPKSTPLEDFGVIDEVTGQITIEVPPKQSLLDKAYIPPMDRLVAPQWVVDGVIPNGVGVIAGVGGVGKTTALMPLVATVAGFDDHMSDIKVKINRHVIYITEDSVQAQKAIYSIKKWRKSQKDINTIYDFIHLYNSNQYRINDLKDLLIEAVERYSTDYRGIMFPPLVVFDTASANIAVDNENDNAEISKYMTMFKQLWAKYNMPIWLVNHLAKSANGMSIDELDAHSARGASAWRDNSNWTANLAIDKDSPDRVMHMMKVREELVFNEIIFSSVTHDELVLDVFGEPVNVTYRYCTAKRSSSGMRIHEKLKQKEEAILKFIKEAAYPSKNDVVEGLSGNRNEILSGITKLISEGKLEVLPLPSDQKSRGKSTYLSSIL